MKVKDIGYKDIPALCLAIFICGSLLLGAFYGATDLISTWNDPKYVALREQHEQEAHDRHVKKLMDELNCHRWQGDKSYEELLGMLNSCRDLLSDRR